MDEKTLLEAIGQMMDEKLEPISNRLEKLETKVDTIQEDIETIKEDVDILKEDSEITREATEMLLDWATVINHVALEDVRKQRMRAFIRACKWE